jgi:hypothetical protein
MKTVIECVCTILIAVLIWVFFPSLRVEEFLISTLFTVSGIMFSVGLGLIVTFNAYGVGMRNPKYLRQIKDTIYKVRKSYILHFIISTFWILSNHFIGNNLLGLDSRYVHFWSILTLLFILFSIFHYGANFIALHNLSNDIVDKVVSESL